MNSVNILMYISGFLIILFLLFWTWYRWRKIVKRDIQPWMKYTWWIILLTTLTTIVITIIILAIMK